MTDSHEIDDLAPASGTTEVAPKTEEKEVYGVDDLAEKVAPETQEEPKADTTDSILKSESQESDDDDDDDDDVLKSKDTKKEEEVKDPTFTYEYEKPEYISKENFDQKGLDEFKDFAKKNNIPDHVFKQLLDTYFQKMNTFATSQAELQKQSSLEAQQLRANQQQAWRKELKADVEIGGANFKQNALYAQKAIDAYGGEPLAKVLQDHGLANHPVLVKAFVKIGRAFGEGEPVLSESSPKQANFDPIKLFYSEG